MSDRERESGPDMLLGRLAIKAGYLSGEQVEALLAEQEEASRAGAPVTLGELCQVRGLLTSGQVQSLLLAQEYALVRNEDRRLGALAIANGFATEDDIHVALDRQKQVYQREKRLPPRLGEVLVEAGVLSQRDLNGILAMQARVRAPSDGGTRSVSAVAGSRAAPEGMRGVACAPPESDAGFLVLETGDGAGHRLPLGGKAVIGRQPENEIPVDDVGASRQHARILFSPRERQYMLTDLNSRNGTLLNGEPVSEPIALRPGDRIQIGDTILRFETGGSVVPTSLPLKTPPAIRMGPQRRIDTALMPVVPQGRPSPAGVRATARRRVPTEAIVLLDEPSEARGRADRPPGRVEPAPTGCATEAGGTARVRHFLADAFALDDLVPSALGHRKEIRLSRFLAEAFTLDDLVPSASEHRRDAT